MSEAVDWKKAYKDLEQHIEHIMEETSELVKNASPKLKIHDIEIARGDSLTVVIDAAGSRMTYAAYLTDRTGKKETIKRPYQKSNTFHFDVEPGRYTFQGFVRENNNEATTVTVKKNVKYTRVNADGTADSFK